jgi:hypothetical protein
MRLRAGVTATLTVLASLAVASPSYAAAVPMTLSATVGPSGGGNTITGTVAAGTLAFPAGTSPTVQFQFNGTGATTCRTTAQDVTQIDGTASALTAGVVTVDPAKVRRISTTKVAFTVPTASYPSMVNGSPSTVNTGGLVLLGGQTTARWNVCVYDSASTTTSTLIASATYTLAVRPTITAILPTSGPASGGQTITVNGTGFGAGTTATLDGKPLTGVTLAANGNSFTAVTPVHAPGGNNWLVVTTSGGPVSSSDPDNDTTTSDSPIPYTFDNSITITPDTAPVGSVTYVDIEGAGFDGLAFDQSGTAAPTDPIPHIFLVQGEYDPATNRGVLECGSVIVLDDTELICALDLGGNSLSPTTSAEQVGNAVDAGTYTMTIVTDGSTNAGAPNPTLLTSGATFTVAPY